MITCYLCGIAQQIQARRGVPLRYKVEGCEFLLVPTHRFLHQKNFLYIFILNNVKK
nr:MAG TPA: hypothetical protein [Bacteriophage sp.]